MTPGSGQPLPPSPPPLTPTPFTYPPVLVVLTIIFLIVFLIVFFSIYLCQCMQNLIHTWPHRHGPATTTVAIANGVDPSIVQSFPLFTYSSVKDYRKEEYGLECAICLLEFKPSDVLRFLTICCHVFHQECIDLWLGSHKTCPVCRRNLTLPPEKSPLHNENHHVDNEDDHDTFVSIPIDDENENGDKKDEGSCCDHGYEQSKVEKFSRSHTTGHSILGNRDNMDRDRFTLILPEHVKSRIIKGHSSSKSWSIFGEL